MKKNFKKVLSILLVTVMLCSLFSICVSAAGPYRITLTGGYRSLNGAKLYGEFSDKFDVYKGTMKTVQGDDYVFMYKSGGGTASQLEIGATYYEFVLKLSLVANTDGSYSCVEDNSNGIEYRFTYTINEKTGEKENQAVVFYTDASGNFTYPEQFFRLKGHDIYSKNDVEVGRWSSSTTGQGTGVLTPGSTKKVSRPTVYGCYYTQANYTIQFLPGPYGTGDVQEITNRKYNQKISLLDAIFVRDDHVQIGWATTENSSVVEYSLLQSQIPVLGNTAFYPVWQEVKYNVSYDATQLRFDTVCEGYASREGLPAAKTFTITNNSNADIKLTLPVSETFNITATGSLTISAEGGSVIISVQPKSTVVNGNHKETLNFDFGIAKINFSLVAKFEVLKHEWYNYKSNNDATYSHDGTETATCIFGCGEPDKRDVPGTMKIFSADNNAAIGIAKNYDFHKTVQFTAYGSGSDDVYGEIEGGKRFVPVSWYVNEEHRGDFEDGNYNVAYVHDDFGDFTLTVKYVMKQVAFDENGDPIFDEDGNITFVNCKDADGNAIEDTKSYNYNIAPSDKDLVEVVRPNMIVNIIFALMGYLVDLIGGLF